MEMINMSLNSRWVNIIKRWVGVCPACKSWRNDKMAKQSGDKWYCTKRINYHGFRGDAQMYLRENLQQFDNLGWHQRIAPNSCGMELLDGEDELGNLKAYTENSDLRDM
jgi:hypothetical protein